MADKESSKSKSEDVKVRVILQFGAGNNFETWRLHVIDKCSIEFGFQANILPINAVNWRDRVDSTQLDTQRSCDTLAAVGGHNRLRVYVLCVQNCKYLRACDIYVRSLLTTTTAAQQNILSASARYLRLQYLNPS
jgi:hypothetical protein